MGAVEGSQSSGDMTAGSNENKPGNGIHDNAMINRG